MKQVKLTELVENMETAIVSYWRFEEGDPIEEGDDLVEVTVDNETYTVPCPVSGILNEVFFDDGDEVEVGETIATVEEESEGEYGIEVEGEEI